jgi:hypothetical protein
LTGEEQRQCSRAAAEGAGKEVQGAPGVSVELGAVMGSLEQDRVAFHDSSTMAKWGGGLLLLRAARGGGRGRRKRWVGQPTGSADEAMGGQGGGRTPNAVGIVVPLFRPWG